MLRCSDALSSLAMGKGEKPGMQGKTMGRVSLHRYAAPSGAAHERSARTRKAVDLEALLVWAFRDQCADRADAAWERMGYGPSADGCAAVERYHLLGAFVDCSKPSPVPMAVHPDAVLVEELVTREAVAHTGDGDRWLLAMHARMGRRPEWLPGIEPAVRPKWKADRDGVRRGRIEGGRIVEGKVEKIWDKRRHAIGCEVELINPPGWIEGYRRQYLEWHRRMAALLARARRLELRDHEVTGFAAPERPWEAHVIEGIDFAKKG